MSVLFNGDTLVAHHNVGESSYLVVTFLGAFFEAAAESHFLLRALVEKEKINCVGVTSRERNLFVSPEIEKIADMVRSVRRPNQKLIMFGQSSGGYAAVKFAKLFDADYVVAFSPVYSIDQTDLQLTPEMQTERDYLENAIRFHRMPRDIIKPGMRPDQDDCPVPLLLVYDIGNLSDRHSADLFTQGFPDGHYVRVRNFGHAIFNRLEEPELTTNLLRLLADDQVGEATRFLIKRTRHNEAAIADLMTRIARWRPEVVSRALETKRAQHFLRLETKQNHPYNNILAYELSARGQRERAVRLLCERFPDVFAADGHDCGLFVVMSYFGEFLSYDGSQARVVLMPGGLTTQGRAPVLLDLRQPTPRFVVQVRSGEIAVEVEGMAEEGASVDFTVQAADQAHVVHFQRSSKFLSGAGESVPMFDRDQADDWETFIIFPVASPDVFRASASLSWLEETALVARSKTPGTPAVSPSSDTARRKASFRAFLRFFS